MVAITFFVQTMVAYTNLYHFIIKIINRDIFTPVVLSEHIEAPIIELYTYLKN